MKAIQLQSFGDVAGGVRLVDLADVGAPGPDEVVVAMEASPITGSDHLIIAGRYGFLPALPSVLGLEGVGRVVAAGREVKHLKEGDRTLLPLAHPAWAERVKFKPDWQRPLPGGEVEQLSMLLINPATAYLLLSEFVTLKRGDWVIQNGANSPVGRAVIAIAHTLGLKTVNVVRRPELVEEIRALGGDVVLVDGPDLAKQVAAETGKAAIALGLDMVSDVSTLNLMNALAPGGTVVLYAAASQKALLGSPTQLIFNNQSLRGFWLVSWFKTAPLDKIAAMYERLAEMVASGAIHAPIAGVYGFERYAEAISEAGKRAGKVILKPVV